MRCCSTRHRPEEGGARPAATRDTCGVRALVTALCCGALAVAALACGTGASGASAGGTATARQTAPAVVVWAIGDADAGGRSQRLAAFVRRQRVDRFAYLGDVYEAGTAREFRRGYDALWGPLARRTTPTPGNHEWGNRDVGYRPYWRGKLGHAIPDWQRVRLGAGWELLSLNSQGPHGAGSEQLQWLERATRRPGTCRIAIFHRPRFSSGWHGDQADVAPLWNALRGHARLVLSGHDHDLQRFADRDGLRQLVSGAGGRVNIPIPRRSRATARFTNRLTSGGVRLRLTPGHASIEFVAAGGRVLDRSSATCRAR